MTFEISFEKEWLDVFKATVSEMNDLSENVAIDSRPLIVIHQIDEMTNLAFVKLTIKYDSSLFNLGIKFQFNKTKYLIDGVKNIDQIKP